MSEWIPFLQSLVWPVFLAVFLFLAREQVRGILTSIKARVERGDPFQAGPGGISFGQSDRKFTRLGEEKEVIDEDVTHSPVKYKKLVYLIHSVTGPRVGSDNVERRDIGVILDADSEKILDKVERVVYHLHPTFRDPDMEVTDRERRFELVISAWGQFNLSADVHFTGYEKPLTLYRYLNF
jgi:hypothetical protein